jgi:hypothetical protein
MAKDGDIYIGPTGSLILLSTYGRNVTIIPDEIGRSKRTFGGTLKTDITSIKYSFKIPYGLIDGGSLSAMLTLYDLHQGLELKIYDSSTTWFLNDDDSTPVVKMNPISRNRFMSIGSVRYWKKIDLVLDEI